MMKKSNRITLDRKGLQEGNDDVVSWGDYDADNVEMPACPDAGMLIGRFEDMVRR